MRISDWSSDVCSSDLGEVELRILIEDVEHGDVQRAVERVGRQAESDAEIELGQPVALERGATADERAIGADRRIGHDAAIAVEHAEVPGRDRKSTRLNSSH